MYASIGIQTDDDLMIAPFRDGAIYEKHHKPQIHLKCHPCANDFERKLPTSFKEYFSLRQDLLNNATPANEPPNTSSILLNLPYDILSLLFTSLDHAPSQICLLLTCKRLAADLSPLRLALSRTSPKLAGHLPARVFDVPGLLAQLAPVAPPHLRLCAHCLTLRPCPNPSVAGDGDDDGESYWADVAGCGPGCDFWIQKTGWEFHGGRWNKQVHDICPYCHGSCSLGDFGDCDGCSALGRLGDVNWGRLGTKWGRQGVEEEIRAGRFAT